MELKTPRPAVDRCLHAEAWLPLGNPRLLLRFLWYSWITPLVWKGYSTPIEESDLNELPRRHHSKYLGAALASAWEIELSEAEPSIWRAYRHTFGSRWLQLFVVTLLDGIAATAAPWFLGELLKELDGDGSDGEPKKAAFCSFTLSSPAALARDLRPAFTARACLIGVTGTSVGHCRFNNKN